MVAQEADAVSAAVVWMLDSAVPKGMAIAMPAITA
jgi:hypothetical protein